MDAQQSAGCGLSRRGTGAWDGISDSRSAEVLHDNLVIETNTIRAAKDYEVEKLLFVGSAWCYPQFAKQPIAEQALLTGPMVASNEFYGIAKIAGVKLCDAYRRQYGCDFISVMLNNIYGPGDRFDPQTDKEVIYWRHCKMGYAMPQTFKGAFSSTKTGSSA